MIKDSNPEIFMSGESENKAGEEEAPSEGSLFNVYMF